MSTIRLLSAFVAFSMLACGTAWSQQYPSRPVRVIIVFAPGGATDVVGRIVFQKVGEQLKQQFLIDNRTGAGGTIGAAIAASSPADGYTIMVYSATILVNAHLYNKLPYDALKDFIGLSPVARLVGALVVHPSMPVRTTKDFINLAKARPGEIFYGTGGSGAFQHLSTSLFASMTGLNLIHVPYKGGAPAVAAMMAGEVQVTITPMSEIYVQIKAGRLRPIAVTSDTRTTQFPELPTIAETVQGYEFTSWMGTFVPAGTPKPIVDLLNAEIKKAVADPEVAAKLSAQTLDPMYMTTDDFAKHLKAEYDKYGKVVKLSGATLN